MGYRRFSIVYGLVKPVMSLPCHHCEASPDPLVLVLGERELEELYLPPEHRHQPHDPDRFPFPSVTLQRGAAVGQGSVMFL